MPQSALDLKVWKELAINKQILIKTATDALGLDPECSEEELKVALGQGIQQISEADSIVSIAREENLASIASMEQKLTASDQSRLEFETLSNELLAEKQALQALLETTRETSAAELKKAVSQLEEKKKALKAINVALADTPENVVKKLKALNKKKHDESVARKQAEDESRGLKKEKQELQERVKESASLSTQLAEKYKALQEFCGSQYEQLKELADDGVELERLPELDEELLEKIDKMSAK